MFKLIANFLTELLFDEGKAKRYLRGFALALSTLAAQAGTLFAALTTEQLDALLGSPKRLALMLVPSFLAGFGGLIGHGDKTPPVLRTFAATLNKPEVRNN